VPVFARATGAQFGYPEWGWLSSPWTGKDRNASFSSQDLHVAILADVDYTSNHINQSCLSG
jgi:hypothetical protein